MLNDEKTSPASPFDIETILHDVTKFAELGDHQTASPVDKRTSEWIFEQLQQEQIEAIFDPFPLRQFQLESCSVKLCGETIEAFPLWHPTSAGDMPIRERITTENVSGKIALAQFDDLMVTPKSCHEPLINKATRAGAKAIIGYSPHPSGEIYGQNVIPPFNQKPWPLPVAMVAPKHSRMFIQAAAASETAELTLSGIDDQLALANNVIGRIKRGPKWIIVSTPQSGWFGCAGERGAGVALLLAIARWAARSKTEHSFLFLSNSGHELGHMGIHHIFEQDLLPAPADTACWLHLGSSIGTYGYEEVNGMLKVSGPEPQSWLYASDNLIETLKRTFNKLPHLKPEQYNLKRGEIRWILEQGYPAFALMGPQRYFHLRRDGPEVVNPQLLSNIGHALTLTFKAL